MDNDNESFQSDSRSIDDAAAKWFGVCDGGLTPAQETELTAWLRADSRHAKAFERLSMVSTELNRLTAFQPDGEEIPDTDRYLIQRRRRMVLIPLSLAAAAALAVGFVAWWAPAPAPFVESATTEIGVWRQLALPDGSVVELNTDSVVEAEYSAGERRIRLVRGEAHFTVAKAAARPFVVSAGGVNVRAVGTAFNVRLDRDAVEVLVTGGAVEVDAIDSDRRGVLRRDYEADTGRAAAAGAIDGSPATVFAKPTVLTVYQRMVISSRVREEPEDFAPVVVAPVTPVEVSRRLAWQEGRIEFDPTPLRQVVEEFNRYNRHRLVIGDPEAGAVSVGGSFRADDYEAFVRLLEAGFGIVADRHENETVLRMVW